MVAVQGSLPLIRDQKVEEMNLNRKDTKKVIDLYAGVGGIGLGFAEAGYETALAVDFDPFCRFTYDLNHGEPKLIVGDIGTLDVETYLDFDILLAGFPCQPFSVAGYRKGFEDSERGNQFFNIFKIL